MVARRSSGRGATSAASAGREGDMDEMLEKVMGATLGVNGGSGVVLAAPRTHAPVLLTARHVVADGPQATIRWSGRVRAERVIATDAGADIALVDVPRELEDHGLELGPCEVAEEIWLLGFPSGWQDSVPLVSKGTIAGVASSCAWVDGSASWGHSGGPVVAVREEPVVVGGIIGAAGRVHRELEDMIHVAAEEQDLVERTIKRLAR